MRLRISHVTRYAYGSPTAYGLQQLRLTPRDRPGQKVLNWSLHVDGGHKQAEFHDQNDNLVTLISMEAERYDVSVRSEGEIETSDASGVIGFHAGRAPLWYFRRATQLTTPGTLMRQIAGAIGDQFKSDVSRLHALSAHILQRVPYDIGATDSGTSAEGALEAHRGVCQDHSHIFITAARLLGYPARYVSGYLMMKDRPEQEAGHAWAETHLDGLGWVGFDVSNGICPDDRYVGVATGLDSAEAAPIKGIMLGRGEESMSVSLQVQQQ